MGQAVKIENFSFWYGSNKVVKNVSLDIPACQVTALIGPSGCGKTTLLRSINRMHELHAGTRAEGNITVGEQNILDPAVDPVELRRRVGMIFQKPSPFPHLSVFDNVAVGLHLHGLASGKGVAERVEACLRKAALWNEVKDDLHRKGGALSGGQQQRLCIARALAVEPEVFLMDEPCAALDPVGTMRIEELIRELKHEYTVVIVTHNMHQASRISDQTAFALSGELVEVGPTAELFVSPKDPRTEAYLTWKIG